MIHPKKKFVNPPALLPITFLIISLLGAAYVVFGWTNSSPQKKIVELFFTDISQEKQAEAKKYWCLSEPPFNRVSTWQLEQQKKSNSLKSINPDIDIEKVAAAFPDLKVNLYRLARFENFQLVYSANASTKSGSNAIAKKWIFEVWEREKILRYRKLAESILSEMYADVENPGQEGDDLLKSINAARSASEFAEKFAHHPLWGNLDNLSSVPYCILTVQEVKVSEK